MVEADRSFWSRWEVLLVTFIIIIAAVIAGGYASYSALSTNQNPASLEPLVRNGDTVSVDYIGMFEDGTVFDTSIRSIAENNTLYPKSLSFSPKSEYIPLSFTVGAGQMISGFDKGVIGMAVNQTKVLTIPAEEAYGQLDESLIETRTLSESVPIFEWFGNATSFYDTYMIEPMEGVTVKNQMYGWNMTVYHVDPLTEKVLLKNNPFFGEIVHSTYGWDSKVVSIDSSANKGIGEIVIRHLLTQDDIGSKFFSDVNGNQFKITKIDSNSGSFTVDFNREVVGRTLKFKVTIVSLTPAAEP